MTTSDIRIVLGLERQRARRDFLADVRARLQAIPADAIENVYCKAAWRSVSTSIRRTARSLGHALIPYGLALGVGAADRALANDDGPTETAKRCSHVSDPAGSMPWRRFAAPASDDARKRSNAAAAAGQFDAVHIAAENTVAA